MWINGAKAGFEVMAIMTGGPAQQAGLKVGDIITAVNGKPAGDLTLYGLREMLSKSAPGTRVKLTVGKGAKAHDVSLVLRRLIPQKDGLKKAA
jgi:C-terminal processing protease CtpA/Prc